MKFLATLKAFDKPVKSPFVILITAILVAIPSFIASYNFVFNMFYEWGSVNDDFLFLAFLIWKNSLVLQAPPFLNHLHSGPFSSVHVWAFFSILSWVSHFVSSDMITYFAWIQASTIAWFAIIFLYILKDAFKCDTSLKISACVILSILFSFNGIIVATIHYPHPDMLMLPSLLTCLYFLQKRWCTTSALFLLITILVREDGGIHLGIFIGALILLKYLSTKKIDRTLLIYMLFSISGAALMFWYQKINAVDQILINMHVNHSGSFFGHLKWDLLKDRFLIILTKRQYFYVPVLLICTWSLFVREFKLILGILAIVPWCTFNTIGGSLWAGGMYFYYGMLYLPAIVWPFLIYPTLVENFNRFKRNISILFAVLVISSATFLGTDFDINKYKFIPSQEKISMLKRFQLSLKQGFNELGPAVLFEPNVAYLSLENIQSYHATWVRTLPKNSMFSFTYSIATNQTLNESIDSIVALRANILGDSDRYFLYALSHNLPNTFRVIGTEVYITTRKSLKELPAFQGILIPEHETPLVNFKAQLVAFLNNMTPYNGVVKREDGWHVPATIENGVFLLTTKKSMYLPKGKYRMSVQAEDIKKEDKNRKLFGVEVVAFYNGIVRPFYQEITSKALAAAAGKLSFYFDITEVYPNANFFVRLNSLGANEELLIKDIKFEWLGPIDPQ